MIKQCMVILDVCAADCQNQPWISLTSFTVTPKAGMVIIQWNREVEIDNVCFNIYCATAQDGKYIKINDSLIAAKGISTQGDKLWFIDSGLKNGKTYYYKLEDIDTNGISTFHGPVKAVPRWWYGVGR